MPPAATPQRNTTYYGNIISGNTPNPVSTYINNYNINNRDAVFGSLIVNEEIRRLSNKFHSNKDKFSSFDLFTKQGSTHNLLCVYGFKNFGDGGLEWIDEYDLGGGETQSPRPTSNRRSTTRRGSNYRTNTGRGTSRGGMSMGGGSY